MLRTFPFAFLPPLSVPAWPLLMVSTRSSTLDPTVEGAGEVKQSPSKEAIDPYLVTLEAEDNPQCMSTLRRWVAVLVISSASLCVTCASSVVRVPRTCPACRVYTSISPPLQKWGPLKRFMYRTKLQSLVSVCLLSGLDLVHSSLVHCLRCMVRPPTVSCSEACGLSQFCRGRNIIYRVSYIFFLIFTFPVAFAPNIGR